VLQTQGGGRVEIDLMQFKKYTPIIVVSVGSIIHLINGAARSHILQTFTNIREKLSKMSGIKIFSLPES
jgi:hypothetical protein